MNSEWLPTGETRQSMPGDIHCIPTGPMETTEHEESHTCWCVPSLNYVDPETEVAVWVHRQKQ